MRVDIVGGSYQMDALSWGVQRTINMFPIISEVKGTKDVVALRGCAGLKLYQSAGGGSIRGAHSEVGRGRAFVVSGFDFYEIFNDGSSINRGTLDTGSIRVSVASNGDQIMIVDGTAGYIFTQSTNTFEKITSPNFQNGTKVCIFLGGYFIVIKPDSAAFYISGLNDGLSWDALDFKVVSDNPDNLVSLIAHRGDLWAFGSESVEIFENTGNASFPFERVEATPTGCQSPYAVELADNTIVWYGRDKDGKDVIWKAHGYNAVRISTQAIEKRIEESTAREQSYSWVYHQRGHMFYCLQVKGLDTTLVYDFATQQWHERSYKNAQLNKREQHRGSCHFSFDNKNLVGDRENGNIYELSLDVYTDNGDEMIRERISPHYHQEKQLISHNTLELDCEVGRGMSDGQAPMVMMRYSNDGGRTWSSELWRSLGKVGEYLSRVRWMRLGASRDRVYHFSISDDVFVQINQAYINGA